MSQTTPDPVFAIVEQAIEQGRLTVAREMLLEAETRLGRIPAVIELRRRLDEIERITAGPQVEGLMRKAQEAISRADYPAAIRLLDEAVELAPHDGEIRTMRDQTDKAALRHLQQLKRNQAIREEAERIERALERGQLESARQLLADAGLKYGKHGGLTELQEQLEKQVERARLEKAKSALGRARHELAYGQPRSAFEEVEQALKLDPQSTDALALREEIRTQLEREEGHRHREQAVVEAQRQVQRLIAAGELERASVKLREVIDAHGREDAFRELALKITEAKVDLQTRQRLEWVERRKNEAVDLVREADRLSLQAHFEAALAKLESASELDPDDTTISAKLQTARAALERQQAKRAHTEALAARETRIRGALEALDLEGAAQLLHAVRAELGDSPGLQALAARLARLSQAETAAPRVAAAGEQDEKKLLARQQALAAAYSWRQTLLYPLRGLGARVFWLLFIALVVCDVAGALAGIAGLAPGLRAVVILAALSCHFGIVRSTVAGRNHLPARGELGGVGRQVGELVVYLAVLVLAFLPLAIFVLLRGRAAFLSEGSSLLDWLAAVLLGWLAMAVVTLAAGTGGGFGTGRALRLWSHPRGLVIGGSDALLIIDLIFAPLAAALLVRIVLQPLVPWLGSPLAAAIEAYWLLGAPHWMGVLVRRHRLELGRVYG